MSYTPIATPTGIHDTMIRDSASTCQPQNTSVCACVCVCKNMRVCPQTAHTLLPPTLLVSLKPVTPGRRALSGTKQRSNSMSAFCMQRMAILFSIFVAVKPGVPLRTMNAFTCASRRHSAQHSLFTSHHTRGEHKAGVTGLMHTYHKCSAHLAILAAARPHNRHVGPCAIANPALAAIELPATSDACSTARKATGIAAIGGLCQRPAA